MKNGQNQDEVIKLLNKLNEKVDDLSDTLKDKISDLYSQIFTLRAELKELERKMLRRFTEVRESQNIVIGFFDKNQLKLADESEKTRKRLDKIEDYLKISAI